MSIYLEEMLLQIEALDAFCERLQRRMAIEPVPSGLEVEAEELVSRIETVQQALPSGINMGDWGRKTHFIKYYLARREPQNCENDLAIFRNDNIPTTVKLVKEWANSLASFDRELRDAVKGLIRAREFASAIRAAFVILTERLRSTYNLAPGVDGPALVNEIYGAKSTLANNMSPSDRQAMRDYLAGAYGVLRNKYAHGTPPLDLVELEASLATVNLALKLLATS